MGWRPSSEQMALAPGVSGDAINGVGEAAPRRPSPVYWHDPAKLAYGAMQQFMVARFMAEPRLADSARRYGGRGPAQAPLATERVEEPATQRTERLKAFALAAEADLVGVADMDPLWVFEGADAPERFVVVLGVAMDHAKLATAPEIEAAEEVQAQYNRGARAARKLANWLRGQGWEARPHGGPYAGAVNLVPVALACGFGELGKHGSIINPDHGSAFRLACVLTDAPLVPDAPRAFGADSFCAACQICAEACPPKAISHEKRLVRGVEKWSVEFDACVPYFNETHGCGVCIAVCPWSRPGVGPRLVTKLARKMRHSSFPAE